MPISSFIGRETEMAELLPLLESNRLVTLTGAGGTGKTRLARQVAEAALRQFQDGIWLVQLSPLRDPVLIPDAIAAAAGIQPRTEQALMSALKEHFQPRHTLMVLDNCEHVIDGVADVAEALLHAAPGLKILATSRERLNIDGEVVWPVRPLATPDLSRKLTLAELTRFDGVRFFAERARAVQPGFSLTEETAPVVAQIARRLDGIPLALELAAACVRSLSVTQIADRLSNRFGLLVDGRRTAPERQATLRQAIDWTHDLLTDDEQRLWHRLTVFPADFSLQEAEQVCAGEGISAEQIGRLITRLVDKSVLVAEENEGGIRYRMLETMRHYGAERLEESGQAAYWRARHIEGYVIPAETAAGVRLLATMLVATTGSIPLSDREREIVTLVVEGLSRVEMAKRLFISPFTVDRYLQQIYDKLQLASRSKAELAAWAIRTGLRRS